MSISILLTTIGRQTLTTMLASIKHQLNPEDHLYIVIDGPEFKEKVENQLSALDNCRGQVHVICHPTNIGYSGHGLRNFYQSHLLGDWITHGDDDDAYLPGALAAMRHHASKAEPDTILMFRFFPAADPKIVMWIDREIKLCNIGTPSGLIPNQPDKMGKWAFEFGGDCVFYKTSKFKYKFIDEKTYILRPHIKTNKPKKIFN